LFISQGCLPWKRVVVSVGFLETTDLGVRRLGRELKLAKKSLLGPSQRVALDKTALSWREPDSSGEQLSCEENFRNCINRLQYA
jgi:hypothetical protein